MIHPIAHLYARYYLILASRFIERDLYAKRIKLAVERLHLVTNATKVRTYRRLVNLIAHLTLDVRFINRFLSRRARSRAIKLYRDIKWTVKQKDARISFFKDSLQSVGIQFYSVSKFKSCRDKRSRIYRETCSHAFVRARASGRVSGHRIRRRPTRRCPSTRHRADLTLDEHTNLTRGNRSRLVTTSCRGKYSM